MKAPLVIALNPSVDAEWRVPQIQFEEKNEIQSERRWAGGKGINVARWLRHLGTPGRLLLPLGGATGSEIEQSLNSEALPILPVRIAEPSRVNVIVTPPRGHQMRFNAIPPRLSSSEWTGLRRDVTRALKRSNILVLSGSLPQGVPLNAYAGLLKLAHQAGIPSILDCEGEALRQGISGKPTLVKPNQAELQAWYGQPITNDTALLKAARLLAEKTGGWVLVSTGERGGWLVHADHRDVWNARPSRTRILNTVGAGDALVAAVTQKCIENEPPAVWLYSGVVAGTAATRLPAGELPTAALVRSTAKTVRLSFSS